MKAERLEANSVIPPHSPPVSPPGRELVSTTPTKLTGKALKDRARELDIKGRSKMSADELREAIRKAELRRRSEEKALRFGENYGRKITGKELFGGPTEELTPDDADTTAEIVSQGPPSRHYDEYAPPPPKADIREEDLRPTARSGFRREGRRDPQQQANIKRRNRRRRKLSKAAAKKNRGRK